MVKRPVHGPGNWICWDCFLDVSNDIGFKTKWRLIDTGAPDFGMDYRAKVNAPCKRCGAMIYKGQKTQKMSVDMPLGLG